MKKVQAVIFLGIGLSLLIGLPLQAGRPPVPVNVKKETTKSTHEGYRNYSNAVTSKEKKDIRFILKNMAQKSLASLLSVKSQMEDAGDRIEHLHPLRFLEAVFSDEELKAYFHQVKKRGSWLWSEFSKGLKTSMQEEFDIGNFQDAFIYDFSSNLNIDASLIQNHIHSAQWDDLIKALLQHLPRSGDFDRYDM